MRAVDLIAAKRSGAEHSDGEIRWLVESYVAGAIPDYQVAAWLMAVCFAGLTRQETFVLTDAMVRSGEVVDLSDVGGIVADKHSTGGVGDKVSLVLGPLVASCGVPFAKMSGRGLGHTGGTIDKLESIPGFRTELTADEFRRQVAEVGVAIVGQAPGLVPADKLLYALRDVTATVEQESLIASSVMSKKIAAGATAIVLDVKVGGGAFLHDMEKARRVARTMIDLGRDAGRDVRAILSDMDEPLGFAVGNALEVREALEVLSGGGPTDLREVVLVLAGHLLVMARKDDTLERARARAAAHLDDGSAREAARRWLAAQGADPAAVDGTGLPQAPAVLRVRATQGGHVQEVAALAIAEACLALGAGRESKGAAIEHSVGVVLKVKGGAEVDRGDVMAVIHARTPQEAEAVEALVASAFHVGTGRVEPRRLILDEIPEGV
ncbi:MAG TPA: thymidine phosphorylase [Thermoleophilia bacterium]|nr:thymidine phosphorylase [Thermoleophilia bacterium]